MYKIEFTEDALKDLHRLQRKAPQAIKKLKSLLEELQEHPRTGTGQVEQFLPLFTRHQLPDYLVGTQRVA